MYLFQKNKISKNQEAFVRSAIEDFKSQVSQYHIPKLSFLKYLDNTQKYPTNQELEYIQTMFNNISLTITKTHSLMIEHSNKQTKTYSSFDSKKNKHEEQVDEEISTFIFNYMQTKVMEINTNYKNAKDELNIFTFYQTKLSKFILDLKTINNETNYTHKNEFINIITESYEILTKITNSISKLPNELEITSTKKSYESLAQLCKNLTIQINNIIHVVSEISSQFYIFIKLQINTPNNFKSYATNITDAYLTNLLNVLTNENKIHNLTNKPVIVRYARINLNRIYTILYSDFLEFINAFSNKNNNPQFDTKITQTFNAINTSVLTYKESIIKYRDERINQFYEYKLKHVFTDLIEQKILYYYNSGDYQEILKTIMEIDPNHSLYVDKQITSAKHFQASKNYVFHGISFYEEGPNGSWESGTLRILSPELYAQRIINIITHGLKASNRDDSPFMGKLEKCQETYYFITPSIPNAEDERWHYGYCAVLFDAHNKFAVQTINKPGSSKQEYIIITNPKYPIITEFTLIINISSIKNTRHLLNGLEYITIVMRILDEARIKYIKI